MHVLGHNDESMQFESSLPFVTVEGFQKKSAIGFDQKETPALPGRESNEISAGRGDCASRPHSTPQRLEAAHLQSSTARLKAVPFPFKIGRSRCCFGKESDRLGQDTTLGRARLQSCHKVVKEPRLQPLRFALPVAELPQPSQKRKRRGHPPRVVLE